MKNYIEHDRLDDVESLESVRHLFKPHRYQYILAESLVHYFSTKTDNLTAILQNTNKRLEQYNLKDVTLGFVRSILNRR